MTVTASSLSSLILLDTDFNVILNPDGTPVTGQRENGHIVFGPWQGHASVVVSAVKVNGEIVPLKTGGDRYAQHN